MSKPCGKQARRELERQSEHAVMMVEELTSSMCLIGLEYAPPEHTISRVNLDVGIFDGHAIVTARLHVSLRNTHGDTSRPLLLHKGKLLSLLSITVDGVETTPTSAEECVIAVPVPVAPCIVVTRSMIFPEGNTELEGLYRETASSSRNYITQCEAEGFREISPFIDRPDNLAIWTVSISASKAACPVLLSNGDCTDKGDLPDGRHFAVWHDPHPKPSYLFALVAGDLVAREATFTTRSGCVVAVRVWTSASEHARSAWALESALRAMRWDEDRFGLEYDETQFNIVATPGFSAICAMENKSLNIFDSQLILASPETATDTDFRTIQGLVGHEYFHNWTGNRVTCRSWFELTLKEGLTMYRDREFTSDLNSRAVKRIDDVTLIRSAQFPEDAGPLSHPIRPEAYDSVSNLYSETVYEKGAEIIGLYATLLGRDGFRRGLELYIKRHDGQAVVCEDFWQAMADSNVDQPAYSDLPALWAWYDQSGTPRLSVRTAYDKSAHTFTVHARQVTPGTADQPSENKKPVLIPIAVGLLGPDGADLPLTLAPGTKGALVPGGQTAVLRLSQAEASYVFTEVHVEPVPSILRGFSAPVSLTVEGQSPAHLLLMSAHDSDFFNRYEAGQRLSRTALLELYSIVKAAQAASGSGGPLSSADFTVVEEGAACALAPVAEAALAGVIAAFRAVLTDARLDGAFMARAATLPTEQELFECCSLATDDGVNPVLLAAVRSYAGRVLAASLRTELVRLADPPPDGPFSPAFESAARRAISGKALAMLAALREPGIMAEAARRAAAAREMTTAMDALACLADLPPEDATRAGALAAFYDKWAGDQLVMNKWLGLLAGGADATRVLRPLVEGGSHPVVPLSNPSTCLALFCRYAANAPAFHAADGSGYAFLADAIHRLDALNSWVAARLAGAFVAWRRVDPARGTLMREQLQRLADSPALSAAVADVVSRAIDTRGEGDGPSRTELRDLQ